MFLKRFTGVALAVSALVVGGLALGCEDNGSTPQATALDGIWSRSSGYYSFRISSNNWVYSEDGSEYSKGTWSTDVTPAAPSYGILTLTATEIRFGGSWTSIPAEYADVRTNTATFSIDESGTSLTLSDAQLTTAGMWGTTEGTYTKVW